MSIAKYAIYLGKFNPIHFGHMNIINNMIAEFGYENSLLLIGSCNNKLDMYLYFTYSQRRNMIKSLYSDLSIVGLPDFKHVDQDPEYKQWHQILWDIIRLKFPDATIENVVFYSGSKGDAFFYKGYNVKIIERSDENHYSSSEVRERLILNLAPNPILSLSPTLLLKDKTCRQLELLCDLRIINKMSEFLITNMRTIEFE